jgi:hypothetical protein
VEVVLRDGRRITGLFIDRSPERVVLSISGIATPFTMDGVERVRLMPSVESRYRELRAAIDDEDLDSLLRLAEWLRSRGRLDLALWEVDHVLKIEPGNAQAREARTLIVAQQKVAEARKPRTEPDEPDEPDAGKAPEKPRFPLLSAEEINIIRVFETDLKDPPRLLIGRDTIKRFLDRYAGKEVEGRGAVPTTPEARDLFMRQKPAEILGWFFDLRARELYGEVQVLDSPKSMRLFRDNVNRTWLTNNCATSRCHGGEDAGRLWLYNKRSASDAAAYTNFVILDAFKTKHGLGLIDYAQPAKSPLLEMALPRDQAVFKHPEVVGTTHGTWRPVFKDRKDDKYERAIEWIKSMYPQRTAYPIGYTPPTPHAGQTERETSGPR